MADTPSLPGAVGRDFSFRDWYKGVSRNWTPYLSLIYKRAASPRYNVIAAAFPIKHTTTQEILGILVLQIRLDILYAWSEEIKVGDKGLLYFVDPEGNVAGHPGFWAQGEITNFSTLPFVQKTLKGNHGVQFSRDTLQHHKTLVAFAPVKKYGWGVIVEEPLESAFGSRNQTLWVLILIYTLILILNSFTARFIEKVFTVLEKQRQIIKEAMQ
jgi:hypothetical protein